MKYSIAYTNPSSQLIEIQARCDFNPNEAKYIQLPVWRPGRYEKGDFAQYVIDFSITDSEGTPVDFKKKNSSLWEIYSDKNTFHIQYKFYAAILNAGSTWLDTNQLYVNPVNCLVYIPGREDEACQLQLHIPADYEVAGALQETEKHKYHFASFHQLVDSPFIASKKLQHFVLEKHDISFHFWFSGECKPDWEKIQQDLAPIIQKQLDTMQSFPSSQYHVLTHVLPYHAYHGVEHTQSTVLTLGPSHEFMQPSLYNEFIGIFSHELFHVWNVKTIRPADFLPYAYNKENYSELGYIYEGVTTYYGDVFALRARSFSWDFFSGIAADWFTKHYHNFGRLSYSVSQSSFDTWLDGYKLGAPNRKVNMYNEGALCAWMVDLLIRKNTQNQASLDDVLRTLNQEFGNLKKGYTRNDYKAILEKYAGQNLDIYFSSFLEGTEDYGLSLIPLLEYIGLDVFTKENSSYAASQFGFKIKTEGSKQLVQSIAIDSPAEKAGMMLHEEIRSINGVATGNQADAWLQYFADQESIEIVVSGTSGIRKIKLQKGAKTYYPHFVILKKENASEAQRQAFEAWAHSSF